MQILEQKSTKLFKQYWQIKPNTIFFKKLIDTKVSFYKEIVQFITTNNKLFLDNDTFKEDFCSVLLSLNEPEYILSTAELLIKDGCNIQRFYINTALEYANSLEPNDAFNSVNHVLDVLTLNTNQKDAINFISDIKTSWPLMTFAKMNGKMSLVPVTEKDTNITYKTCVFTNSNDDRLFVGFSSELGELTPKEIAEKKTDLKVVECKSGQFYLCAQNLYEDLLKLCDSWITLFVKVQGNEYQTLVSLSQKIKFLDDSFETIGKKISYTTQIQNSSFFKCVCNC